MEYISARCGLGSDDGVRVLVAEKKADADHARAQVGERVLEAADFRFLLI